MGVLTSCADTINTLEICFSLAASFPHKVGKGCEISHSSEKRLNSERDWLAAGSRVLNGAAASVAQTHAWARIDGGCQRGARTSLEGLRRTSPTPPPLLRP